MQVSDGFYICPNGRDCELDMPPRGDPKRQWWTDDVPVPTFGPRMVCTRRRIIGADARANWKEQPTEGAFASIFNPMSPLSIAVVTAHV
jgi:hypothetical protein